MTISNFLYLILGIAVGSLPTAIRLITKKIESLDAEDPVTDAIVKEAIRKLSDKKPLMKQPETVVHLEKTNESIPSV